MDNILTLARAPRSAATSKQFGEHVHATWHTSSTHTFFDRLLSILHSRRATQTAILHELGTSRLASAGITAAYTPEFKDGMPVSAATI